MAREVVDIGQHFKLKNPILRYDTQDTTKGLSLYSTLSAIFTDLTNNVLVRRIGIGEKQLLTFPSVPDAGEFKLTFQEQTTSAIPYTATANDVRTALEALSNVGAGDVNVSGDFSVGFTIDFLGSFIGRDVHLCIFVQGASPLLSSATPINGSVSIVSHANSSGITLSDSQSVIIPHGMGAPVSVSFIGNDGARIFDEDLIYTIDDLNTITVTNGTGSMLTFYCIIATELNSTFSTATKYQELTSDPATPSVDNVVVYAKNKKIYVKDSNGTVSEVGSGSAGVNYCPNPDAETGTVDGWVAYQDVAGVSPIDGIGGTPTVSIATTDSNPLRGTRSFLISKDAANRQGEGVSIPFSIDRADFSSDILISIDYAASGDASVFGLFVYDITNNILIPVTSDSAFTGNGRFIGSFVSTTSSSYRLIFHCKSTSSSVATLKLDAVSIEPRKPYGSIVSLEPVVYVNNLVSDTVVANNTYNTYATLTLPTGTYIVVGHISIAMTGGVLTYTTTKVENGSLSTVAINHTKVGDNADVYYHSDNLTAIITVTAETETFILNNSCHSFTGTATVSSAETFLKAVKVGGLQ